VNAGEHREAPGPWLAGVMLLALGLRLWGLGRQSLWLDEAFSVYVARADLESILRAKLDLHPPFYLLLLHAWMAVVGQSEFAVRLLSLVFDVGTVGLVYVLGHRVFSPAVGLLAAFLLALSPFHVYFAQEARAYALLCFLVLLSTLLFLRALGSNRWADWASFGVISLLALYTHYYAVFVLFTQGIYLLVTWRMHSAVFRRWLAVAMALGVVYLPWLLYMLSLAGQGGHTWRRYLWLKIPYVFLTFSLGYSAIGVATREVGREIALRDVLVRETPILLGGLVVFGLAFLGGLRESLRQGAAGRFLALFSVLPVLVVFSISFKLPIISERYLIWVAPVYLLLVAAGLATLWRYPMARVVHACAALLLGVALVNHASGIPEKEQWREVAAYMQSAAAPGDVVAFHKPWVRVPFEYYAHAPVEEYVLPEGRMLTEHPEDRLREDLGRYRRVWLVLAHNFDTEDYYPRLFRASFAFKERRTFTGIVLELFEVAPGSGRMASG
jgi:mannosyltransferase